MTKLLKTIPAFPVQQINKSVEFYKDKFGFDCRHMEETFAILVRGDIEIQLWLSVMTVGSGKAFFCFLSRLVAKQKVFWQEHTVVELK
jgi:hypothetical protein